MDSSRAVGCWGAAATGKTHQRTQLSQGEACGPGELIGPGEPSGSWTIRREQFPRSALAVAMTELARRIDVKLGTLILALLAAVAATGVAVWMLA